MSTENFTVIIPTLQRSSDLRAIVEQCAAHPDVDEVTVVNNAEEPLEFDHRAVRVLQPGRNIFVNPAWNLGVRESRGALLAIINDDVRFRDEALSHAAALLRRKRYGIIGPDRTCFSIDDQARGIGSRIYSDPYVVTYGTFMCLRRENYVPIPEELTIWGGDNWLLTHQRKANGVLIRTPFRTDMGTTSSSPEFSKKTGHETDVAERLLIGIRPPAHVRLLVGALEKIRRSRHSLKSAIDASRRRSR
ncbi:glycosyltransferase [Brachybacterium sp. JHP9]|uniref:Glycosyltransferase n=1 Tax=Brachybacterium equifaecis TaxID=2910770 RepID=A0ABT0R016_9MICO|nr:glycosyltransferase [Brachybacterium equifaecis]MCL6423254.1 glycosyltransferase [Brachybacterium equifaecis]